MLLSSMFCSSTIECLFVNIFKYDSGGHISNRSTHRSSIQIGFPCSSRADRSRLHGLACIASRGSLRSSVSPHYQCTRGCLPTSGRYFLRGAMRLWRVASARNNGCRTGLECCHRQRRAAGVVWDKCWYFLAINQALIVLMGVGVFCVELCV